MSTIIAIGVPEDASRAVGLATNAPFPACGDTDCDSMIWCGISSPRSSSVTDRLQLLRLEHIMPGSSSTCSNWSASAY